MIETVYDMIGKKKALKKDSKSFVVITLKFVFFRIMSTSIVQSDSFKWDDYLNPSK